MSRIPEYKPLTSPSDTDVLPIVDVSDPTMSPKGTTKKITVSDLIGTISAGLVASVNGQTGPVVLHASDVSADAAGAAATALTAAQAFATAAVATETTRAQTAESGRATLASPVFTGTPSAPTATALTSSTQLATTAYADSAVTAETARATTAEALKAPLASAALTGAPTAPTAAALTSTTQIATTAYADSAVGVEKTRALAAEALAVPLAGGSMTGALSVQGTSSGGQLVFIKQTGTTDHAATIYLAGVGGASQSALNVVSDNTAFSCLEVTGTELNRGTIKIAHKGQSNASDSSAAAVSIDLQTTVGGSTGTAAQGLFITSTTDAAPAGNAITVRYNSSDWFVVKGSVAAGAGIVGIGVATGHTPAGMLEIAQKDTTTFGLAMQAIASGTDMINLKDSGGNQRFQVNNSGNIVARANILATSSMILGTTTSDFGGAGSALTICHTTDPTTNPASGHLMARGSSGTVTQIASP